MMKEKNNKEITTRADKQKNENSKGITLIALIITIIVMLILVSVSINIVINRGLFQSAGKATKDTKNAINAEQELAGGKVTIGGKEYNSLEEYTKLAQGGSVSKVIPKEEAANTKLNSSSVKEVVQTRMLNTTYEAPIPAGFTVSGKESERSIDGGLVIYLIDDKTEAEIEAIDWEDEETVLNLQKTYDQFVWIPIPRENINNMYICQGKTEENGNCNITVTNGKAECQNVNHKTLVEDGTTYKNMLMAGRLYANTTGDKFEQGHTEVYTANGNLREPDIILGENCDDNATYLGHLNSILGTNFAPTTDTTNNLKTSNTDFKTYLQEEYNEVAKSVYQNQGFYIGRYETTGMKNTDTNATIRVVAGTAIGISDVNWYRMYAQQKKYSENKALTTVKSTMIQGAAYDQVMKFVETESYDVKKVGNVEIIGLSGPINTGSKKADQSKNIYDLEANVRALTLECSFANRIYRGGSSFYRAAPSNRNVIIVSEDGYVLNGSVCQLYVVL